MELNLTQEIKKRSILEHLILHCLTNTVAKEIINKSIKESRNKQGDIICDVKLTVNGYELNIESFIKHWQKQVKEIIAREAGELVKEKFGDLNNLFYDLQERLNEEIDKRMEDWEKE